MKREKRKNEVTRAIEENKPIDKKKLILRLAAFTIFLAVAVIFITVGVNSMGRQEAGLQEITAAEDENVPLYQAGIAFQHYFSGSSSAIKMGVRELGELYGSALKDVYRLLDPVNTYDNGANIATLNQNLGREVFVSRELYDVLADAVRYTERGEGYSVFSGALCAEWETLRYLLEPAEFDPARDPDEAARLERLTAATRELSNFRLEFLDDETCKLRFTVDQSYLELLEELELTDAPILDLNALRDAYKLQLVAARLEAKGYDRGFLSSESGVTLALSAYEDGGDFCFYSLLGDAIAPAAVCPVTPGACAVQLRAFAFPEEVGYYAVEAEGETLLRHPWLPADGVFRELLLTGFVTGEKLTAPEACYACLRLFGCDTEAEVLALAKELPGKAGFLFRDEPESVYLTDAALTPRTDCGFTSKTVS
jgi:hypothetical protein